MQGSLFTPSSLQLRHRDINLGEGLIFFSTFCRLPRPWIDVVKRYVDVFVCVYVCIYVRACMCACMHASECVCKCACMVHGALCGVQ